MSVFLDTSNKRKLFFRTAILGIFAFLLLCGAAFFLGFSLHAANRPSISYEDAAERYHYYYSAANHKKIAFTIDDGPNPLAADIILDALEAENAPATFFYIGEKVLKYPNIARDAASRGFNIESHSFTHGWGSHGSYNRMAFELNASGYLIAQMTSTEPFLYRPPFLLGIGIDPTMNPYIPLPEDVLWSLELGYLPVGSDIDPRDWLAQSPEDVVEGFKKAIDTTQNGHIVLLHEDIFTAKAMPQMLAYLKQNGYKIVPLAELITPPRAIALPATLHFGDTDEETGGAVSKLQWFLYTQGYLDPYKLSGIYDGDTRASVADFQIAKGIVDPQNPVASILGVAGVDTRELISRISGVSAVASPAVLGASVLDEAISAVATSMRTLYIKAFPVLRNTLMVVILLALFLVVARTLGLIALFIMRRKLVPPLPLPRRGHDMPGISILVPAYNEQENIAATVESIASSLYPEREAIIIDDGSKDNTAQEVKGVILRYPNEAIQLIQVENGGKASALNTALTYAKHEIIVVLDADAVLENNALYYFARHFADPKVGAVAGKVCTTRRGGILDIFQRLEYAVGQNIDKTAFSTIGAVGIVPGPAGAWRRACIEEAGGFSTDTLVEDQDMTLTLLRQGKKIVYEPEVIAYTETPATLRNFLKQRFRWVYGTMQCFWKHKSVLRENPKSVMSLIVLPNVFVYNILLPFTYPFADSALVIGILFGEWKTLVLPFAIFTFFDLAYAYWGVWREKEPWKLMLAVPLQRIVYRQLLYITVIRGIVRAIEGTGASWNKFRKAGETRRFYFSNVSDPENVDFLPGAAESLPVAAAAGYGAFITEPIPMPNNVPQVYNNNNLQP